jgi:hypothetical protein
MPSAVRDTVRGISVVPQDVVLGVVVRGLPRPTQLI